LGVIVKKKTTLILMLAIVGLFFCRVFPVVDPIDKEEDNSDQIAKWWQGFKKFQREEARKFDERPSKRATKKLLRQEQASKKNKKEKKLIERAIRALKKALSEEERLINSLSRKHEKAVKKDDEKEASRRFGEMLKAQRRVLTIKAEMKKVKKMQEKFRGKIKVSNRKVKIKQ
jgi:erythromycin esterase-like protein